MVCAAEGSSLPPSRSSVSLEVGCLVDTATGYLTFTANGKEMGIIYQVTILIGLVIICLEFSLRLLGYSACLFRCFFKLL